ncbi:glycosyltransferase [Actinomadura logoneensis]|uniref:Glycosyltransferase n=1 Tax=Actinomadura logoneensis TaxID=2293572 RepID=A0A372JCL2_9ACTN|nr:glycosyltransferase family 2 protein [Actinomadura logoneensis]RFU37574.1 glycosyltransferase [Actinomadura logoneensis]
MSGLTVVVPCYNEGAQVETAYGELTAALAGVEALELLFVDDGSSDDTLERLRGLAESDPRVRYLSFTRNFGLEAAQAAAFGYASQPWCAQIDCDLQAPPEEIPLLLAKAAEGYDVVFGVRRDRQDAWGRRVAAVVQQWVARRLLGIELPPGASTFRVVRTEVARTIAGLRLGSPYFLATVPLVGARYTTVPTGHRPRTAGRSKFRLARLAGHSFELFFGFSWRPLNAVYLLAVLGVVLGPSLALATWGLGADGGTALAALGVVLGALTLVCTALVGRYLHRLMADMAKIRPFYIREANVEIRPEDALAPGTRVAPPAGRRAVLQ